MRYLYTDTPDEGCHEINGAWGRPVHNSDIPKLLKAGWKKSPEECSGKLNVEFGIQNKDSEQTGKATDLAAEFEARFGKKPHHKMLPETIQKAIDDHDEAQASQSDSDPAGD